jgi:hypothetical protein
LIGFTTVNSFKWIDRFFTHLLTSRKVQKLKK